MLVKGRKVSGRGEAVAANYAFGPLEDDVIIKQRLLTRTTTTRGEPIEEAPEEVHIPVRRARQERGQLWRLRQAGQSFPPRAQHLRDSAPQEQNRKGN
ncbi:unnamed protein product [Prunus armeniaca]